MAAPAATKVAPDKVGDRPGAGPAPAKLDTGTPEGTLAQLQTDAGNDAVAGLLDKPDGGAPGGPDKPDGGVPGGPDKPDGGVPGGPDGAPGPASGPKPDAPKPDAVPKPDASTKPDGPKPLAPPQHGGPVPDGSPAPGASTVDIDRPPEELSGIDPALVDEELAEHERWGGARATVGGAGSSERAGFIAERVGAGMGSGALTGAGAGLLLSLATRVGTKAATRLLARGIPVPVVGAVIGGAIGAWSLGGELLSKSGRAELVEKLSGFGQGEGYEKAANTIDAIATGLDLVAGVLDTIGAVAGAIALIAAALAIPTLGASLAVATPAGGIATAVSAASAVLALVKLGLQPLVLMFRALHEFDNAADPAAVQARGGQLTSVASAVGGALGGFVGVAAGNKAADKLGLPADPVKARMEGEEVGRVRNVTGHPKGPEIEARRLVLTPEELAAREHPVQPLLDESGRPLDGSGGGPAPVILGPDGQPARPAGTTGTVLGPDGTPVNRSVIIDESAFPPGSVEYQEPAAPRPDDPDFFERLTGKKDYTYGEVRGQLTRMDDPNVPRNMIIEPGSPAPAPPLGEGHGLLVDPQGRELPNQFGPYRGEEGMPVTDPLTGRREWKPESRMDMTAPDGNSTIVRAGPPGSWGDQVFAPGPAGRRQAAEWAARRAAAGEPTIREDSALPHGWKATQPGETPPETYPIDDMNLYEVGPNTPYASSVVAPQPEGRPGPGRADHYGGGGPQVQLPFGAVPKDAPRVGSFPVAKPHEEHESKWATVRDRAGDADHGGTGGKLLFGPEEGGPEEGEGGPGEGARLVLPVNPDYERPPGTPEQLTKLRSQVAALRAARAQADADVLAARSDLGVTERRGGQLTTIAGHVSTLGQQTDGQRQEVAATTDANKQQLHRQTDAGSALGSSASRLAGLGTLEAMLTAWAGVTRVFATVIGAVSDSGAAKMNQMNADAHRFMTQLGQAKMLVSGQQDQQPLMMGRLSGHATTLEGEVVRTTAVQGQVDTSHERLAAIREQNTRDAGAATAFERRSSLDSTEAGDAADQTQAAHDKLAADIQAWAQRHAEQRRLAVAQTADKLRAKGFEVVDAPTW